VNRAPLPNLSVAQLQYLVAAVDADTWADAAAGLDVSQSALSQGLSELQRRLGVELFERRGRRRVPLPHAKPVVEHARRVLAQTADLRDWADAIRTGSTGRVRVGMIDAAAVDHFGETLHHFRRRHDLLDLHLTVAPSSQLVTDLLRGDLDVAVCVDPDLPEVTTVELILEPLLVYAPDGEAGSPTTAWGPWVTFPRGSLTRALIGRALGERGVDFDVVGESHQPEVLREMVLLGMGWTVLPPIQAERPPVPLRPVDDAPLLERQIVAATRRDALPNPAATQLIEELRAASR
jgi:DNA-binding transcriptional LysR family regulator